MKKTRRCKNRNVTPAAPATAAAPEPPVAPPCTFVPVVQSQGDGTFVIKPGKPIERVSVRDAAHRAGVSKHTIYRLIDAGMLESERPSPNKLLVRGDSLERHLAATRDPEYWAARRRATVRIRVSTRQCRKRRKSRR
ncbi:MAG: helix-turn-helix domain-containing protein [Verrucomicrobiota bacterium]